MAGRPPDKISEILTKTVLSKARTGRDSPPGMILLPTAYIGKTVEIRVIGGENE